MTTERARPSIIVACLHMCVLLSDILVWHLKIRVSPPRERHGRSLVTALMHHARHLASQISTLLLSTYEPLGKHSSLYQPINIEQKRARAPGGFIPRLLFARSFVRSVSSSVSFSQFSPAAASTRPRSSHHEPASQHINLPK